MAYGKILDGILEECGTTQILILSSLYLTSILPSWAMVMMGFVAATPRWWSVSQHVNATSNTTHFIWKEKVCPKGNETVVFDKDIHTIVDEWKLICDKQWIPPVLITMQMTGVLIGCISAGHVGDLIGRKKTVLISQITMLIFILVEAFSVNWYMMAASIFCMGIGAGGMLSTGTVFLLEFVSYRWRTIAGIFPTWGVALMLLGGLFKLLPNWRHLCIAMCVTGSVFLTPLWFVPESIRWLLTKNKAEEAKILIKKLAEGTNYQFEDNLEIENLQMDIRKEKTRDQSINYFTLFRLKDLRYKSLIMGFMWTYCSFSYYGLTLGVGNLQGDLSVNMVLMGLSDSAGGAVIWLVAKVLQRRNTTILLFALTFATSFTITIAYAANTADYENIKYAFALISRFFLSSCFLSIVIYTIELFPTEVRSLAYSFTNFMARIGGIASAQNKTLSSIADHLPFTLSGSMAAVSCILCLFLKDTYAEDLPDHLEEETELLIDSDND